MATKRNRRQFIVAVDIPNGVTVAEVAQLIEDAVACWPKSMNPDDPIFDLDGKTIRVKAIPKKQVAKWLLNLESKGQ